MGSYTKRMWCLFRPVRLSQKSERSRGRPIINGALSIFDRPISQISEPFVISNSSQITESPDLPDWIRLSDKPNSTDDEFAIPTVANWTENSKTPSQQIVNRHLPAKTAGTDIDRICRLLKRRFTSPDEVKKVLRECGMTFTNKIIEQVLLRFSNDWITAFGAFIQAKTQTGHVHAADVCNSMVDVLGKAKKFDLMWELVEEMDRNGKQVSLITMSKVIRRLARAGRWTNSIEAFKGIEKFGIDKDITALNMLMDALVKEHSVEHAEEAFSAFHHEIPPNLHTFNILIHGWCKAKNVENASKFMKMMQKYGFQPDVISYTSFIESHCRDKDFGRVEAIFDEMEKKGVAPNTISYTILIHALGKSKELNEVLRIFQRMKERNFLLDPRCYSSLIFALSSAGWLREARKAFEEMKRRDVFPDVNAYNAMIAVECRSSEEEAALKLLREMGEVSCKTDLKTYAPLLKMCCRMRRLKVLSFLLDHMVKNDVSIELGTYSLLVHGLCKSGMLVEACKFFEEIVMKGLVPKDCTYNLLLGVLERKSMDVEKEHVRMLMLRTKTNMAECQ